MPAFIQVSFQLSLSFEELSDEESECMDSEWTCDLFRDGLVFKIGRINQHNSTIYLNTTGIMTATLSMTLVNHRDNMKNIKQANVTDYFTERITIYYRNWPSTRSKTWLYIASCDNYRSQDINRWINYDYRYSMAHKMKALLFDKSTADHHIIIGHIDNDQSMTSPSATICSSQKRSIEMTMVDSPVDIASYSNHRIPVHKLILEQRSPVFKTMLSSTMTESTSNKIIISDFDHDVVREFIRFLYFDTCDKEVLDQHAKSLLAMVMWKACFILLQTISSEHLALKLQ